LIFLLLTGLIGVKYSAIYFNLIVKESASKLNNNTNVYIRNLAESVMVNKSQNITRQMEIYLKNRSKYSVRDLQNNSKFQKIVFQDIKNNGFTSIFKAPSGIVLPCPYLRIIDKRPDFTACVPQEWWNVIEPTIKDVKGIQYHDWKEKSNSTEKKIMTLPPTFFPVEDKNSLVTTTANMSDLLTPIHNPKYNANKITEKYHQASSRQFFLINAIALVVLIAIICGVYLLNHRTVLRYIRPIEKLSEAAKKTCENNWKFVCPTKILQRKDEIGGLARAIDAMSQHVQSLISDLKFLLEENKHIRKAKQKSENHYRTFFNNAPIGFYRTDPDGKILDVNVALLRMLGFKEGQNFSYFLVNQIYKVPLQQLIREKRINEKEICICEKQFRRFDGELFWVENQTYSIKDEHGKVIWFEGSLRDISKGKEAELFYDKNEQDYKSIYKEYQRLREIYNSLLHCCADAIVITDLKGNAQYVSPIFTQWFGWAIEELKGRPIPFIPEQEKLKTEAVIKALVDEGRPCQAFVTKRVTKQGRIVDISLFASCFNDHIRHPAGILTIMRDISEQKKMQAQLQHTQRMEAIRKNKIVQDKGTILIVDDEAVVIEICKDMLEKAGYSVESVTTGKEAISLYQEKSEQIDLVILDMIMPPMGGEEVFDRIKAIRTNAKVLLASGCNLEDQTNQILKRGCNDFIQKPFSLQQLSQKVEEILASK
jgi:PAS domain S-box-containing protein